MSANPSNPLFPDNNSPHAHPTNQAVTPVQAGGDAAVNLIRAKLARIYTDEPDAAQEMELAQATQPVVPSMQPSAPTHGQVQPQSQPQRSKHQQFMFNLSQSGKSLSQIQTEWHHYYGNLPDDDKRMVWQEFYNQSPRLNHNANTVTNAVAATPANSPTPTVQPLTTAYEIPGPAITTSETADRNPAELKQHLMETVNRRAKLKPRHHIQSLLFGLGCGGLALFVVLFGFFNEIVIAPFIQPSRTVSATPIIVGTDGVAASDKPEVIIPKINVQIPLDYTAKSIKEADIQKALESGVVHYPTTALPGQQGNAAFFGHSSNNIFNPGKYKFAFVLLHEMVIGDTFYLTRDGISYAYQVIDKKVVEPTEVGILDPIPGKAATATLITCDPPGTTLKRLAIIGEQVSPNPSGNAATIQQPASETVGTSGQSLPGDAPSLWHRLTSWLR